MSVHINPFMSIPNHAANTSNSIHPSVVISLSVYQTDFVPFSLGHHANSVERLDEIMKVGPMDKHFF